MKITTAHSKEDFCCCLKIENYSEFASCDYFTGLTKSRAISAIIKNSKQTNESG
jgi:hypothetical protein